MYCPTVHVILRLNIPTVMSEIKYKQKNIKKSQRRLRLRPYPNIQAKSRRFFTIADLHCKSSGKRETTLASSK